MRYSRHKENNFTSSLLLVALLLILPVAIWTTQVIMEIRLNINCTGYLKRAGDANTVTLAQAELQRAVSYLEQKNITSGFTSVLYQTPDEDVGFWYNNLKQSQEELSKVTDNSNSLEKSNVLMKLRETLMDQKELTYPQGLSRFPDNKTWAIANLISFILSGLSIWVFIRWMDR